MGTSGFCAPVLSGLQAYAWSRAAFFPQVPTLLGAWRKVAFVSASFAKVQRSAARQPQFLNPLFPKTLGPEALKAFPLPSPP